MKVLTVNVGSSSLRLRLLGEGEELLASADLEPGPEGVGADEIVDAVRAMEAPDAVGHRVVHGGSRWRTATRLDREVVAGLEALTDRAPLHQRHALEAIAAVGDALPEVPAVACFDTAFHATMPEAATTYAVPDRWRERYGLRRYGFHGLSHAYASGAAARELGRHAEGLRVVVAHLGSGCSLSAVVGGASVETTMGFTPLEGVVMATRSGSVDPGAVLWLQEHADLGPREVADALEHESGLLALAGTRDLREVLARRERGDAGAGLAFDVYVHRLVLAVGAMAAAAGGVDGLVFTGGVGEHSPVLRAAVVDRLGHLGLALDAGRNGQTVGAGPDGVLDVSAAAATARTLVVAAREDVQIARETRAALQAGTR